MADPDGRALLATWNHFDYGKQKPPQRHVFRYDVDPLSGLERTLELTGQDAEAMELRLCRGQDAVQGLERGQDSRVCAELLNDAAPAQACDHSAGQQPRPVCAARRPALRLTIAVNFRAVYAYAPPIAHPMLMERAMNRFFRTQRYCRFSFLLPVAAFGRRLPQNQNQNAARSARQDQTAQDQNADPGQRQPGPCERFQPEL